MKKAEIKSADVPCRVRTYSEERSSYIQGIGKVTFTVERITVETIKHRKLEKKRRLFDELFNRKMDSERIPVRIERQSIFIDNRNKESDDSFFGEGILCL